MPRVTVIMPAYNHARFIGQAVTSVLSQSFKDLELLVVDDASRDETPEVLARFSDARLRSRRNPNNIGASASVNDALQTAAGEFIAILNSDDYFFPDKLARQVRFLDENPRVGAVFGLPFFIDEQGKRIGGERNSFRNLFINTNMPRHAWLKRFFCAGNALCHPTALIRRSCFEAVGPYDARLAQLPDLDLWIRICHHFDLHILDEALTAYRVLKDDGNASGFSVGGRIRHDWELQYVLRRYLDLSDRDLCQTFAAEFLHLDPGGRNAARTNLGLLALETGRRGHAPSSYFAFGLDVLRQQLGENQEGISTAEFLRLTGSIDVFRQGAQLSELQRLRNSLSWRLTRPLRAATNVARRLGALTRHARALS